LHDPLSHLLQTGLLSYGMGEVLFHVRGDPPNRGGIGRVFEKRAVVVTTSGRVKDVADLQEGGDLSQGRRKI